MNRTRIVKILRDVLALPTAPFAERHVAGFIRSFATALAPLQMRQDAVGNILIHYRNGHRRVARPVCLTAHMDHPGFVAGGMLSTGRLRASWHGGVFPEYMAGAAVRFFSDGRWVPGQVSKITTIRRGGRGIAKTAVIKVQMPVAHGSPGMWNFPDPIVRNNRIYARACDDLAGVAGLLACIDELVARRSPGEAYFLFTRAEEVGYVGAMAACKLKTIPKRCLIVAVENSSELPDARMGKGPILRVGDKSTTFTPSATSFCAAVANDLAAGDKRFAYQRKLMDGGTCESSAFCSLGYEATGLCIALGNYHNMNKKTQKLGREFVDLADFENLTRWFVALASTNRRYASHDREFHAQLDRLQKEYNPLLERTAW